MKMNFLEKSENVMFLHSLRLSYMQKIRKFYRAVFRENIYRQTERERDRERDRQTETDPNLRVLRTLSLSRRTKKHEELRETYRNNRNIKFNTTGLWHKPSINC